MKELEQIASIKNNYTSSQTVELHPLLRASRVQSTLQPEQLSSPPVSTVGIFSEKLQS